jgi:predicted small metal-binding protein
MEKVVNCDCGWSFRGLEDEVVEAVQRHAREVHSMEVTREQALAQARPA